MTLADFAADVRAPDAVGRRRDRRPGPGRVRWPRSARAGAGSTASVARLRTATREVAAERRALDRLEPARPARRRARAGRAAARPGDAASMRRSRPAPTGRAPGAVSRRPAGTARRATARARSGRRCSTRWRPGASTAAGLARGRGGGARRARPAGDARARLRHRAPRRRRADRARRRRRAARHAGWRSGSPRGELPATVDERRRSAAAR